MFLRSQDAINSASSISRTLSGELTDGQRKLLAFAAAGASSKAPNSLTTQLSNGLLASLHEMVSVSSIVNLFPLEVFPDQIPQNVMFPRILFSTF